MGKKNPISRNNCFKKYFVQPSFALWLFLELFAKLVHTDGGSL